MARQLLPACLAAGLALAAGPAAAQLSALAVWDDLRRLAGEADATVEAATRSDNGGVLTLRDIVIGIEGNRLRATLPELRLSERRDGTVAISAPAGFPIALVATDPETGDEIPAEAFLALDGFELVVSESGNRTFYAFEGDTAAAELGDIIVAGTALDVGLEAETRGFTGSEVSQDGRRARLAPGEADITLRGALALLNRLADAGIISQGHAFSAVFMLGLFARPGDAPDTFETTIEVSPDGAVVANGQPLR